MEDDDDCRESDLGANRIVLIGATTGLRGTESFVVPSGTCIRVRCLCDICKMPKSKSSFYVLPI